MESARRRPEQEVRRAAEPFPRGTAGLGWSGRGETAGRCLHENSAAAPWVGQAGPASLCSVQLKESCRAEGPGCSGRGHGLHHTWLKYTDY